MRSILSIFFFSLFVNTHAQKLSKISPTDFLKIVHQTSANQKILINFWATWCKPCVEELPYFTALDSVEQGKKTRLVFLSFDSPSNPDRVEKFIARNNLKGTHYLIDATDLDSFITTINPTWQGNIPYTILLANDKRLDHDTPFVSLQSLIDYINTKNKGYE